MKLTVSLRNRIDVSRKVHVKAVTSELIARRRVLDLLRITMPAANFKLLPRPDRKSKHHGEILEVLYEALQ